MKYDCNIIEMNFEFYSAPPGCLQWLTGANNIFTTFNWDGTPLNNHDGMAANNGNAGTADRALASQYYKVCFRQELGVLIKYYIYR